MRFPANQNLPLDPGAGAADADGPPWRTGEAVVEARILVEQGRLIIDATLEQGSSRYACSASLAVPRAGEGRTRLDQAYVDVLGRTIGLARGVERQSDPAAFVPTLASHQLGIAVVRTNGERSTCVDAWALEDGLHRAIAAEAERERQRSRLAISRTIGKIRRGAPLRLLALGDSILALQDEMPSPLEPNGIHRDVALASRGSYRYLANVYRADVLSAFALYTAQELGRPDDGGGRIHSRFGYVWELVAALEASGYVLGHDLFYDNLAIGRQSSLHAWSGEGPTAWLRCGLGLQPDLAIIGFGMNERGSPATEVNIAGIVAAFKSNGVECLVAGVPRPRSIDVEPWRATSRALRRAARHCGAAHLPLDILYEDPFIGALGMTAADVCEANHHNHPGIREHRIIGRELSRLLLG